MKILGIETSCDETACAVVDVVDGRFLVLGNTVMSQQKIHAKYGGIVPEVAARKHVVNIIPVLNRCLTDAGVSFDEIDVISVTQGPGLIAALVIGVQTAATLAYILKKPLVSVNHLEGHIVSNLVSHPDIHYPALNLIISGGHTQLVLMKKAGEYEVLGSTKDDAVGECFDKVAKMLDLPYPGGPQIQKLAEHGDQTFVEFPRPLMDQPNLDFSFSGLKTAVKYFLRDNPGVKKEDVCASFQKAVVDVLISKTMKAVQKTRAKSLLLSGGVSANKAIRESFAQVVGDLQYLYPPLELCTDNAVMIAAAGYFKAEKKEFVDPIELDARSGLYL